MDLIERFGGQRDPEAPFGELVANPEITKPISYQLLLMGGLDLDADTVTKAIRSYHPTLHTARAELLELTRQEVSADEARSIVGLAGWGNHVIKLVGFESPIPQNVFDACVRPAHFSEQLKTVAKEHRSHVILYYAGYAADPLEQYVAMTVVAAALARAGGILLLNESARCAFPAEALWADEADQDSLETLRAMPIPLLYGGFVKIEIEDEPGVWMRTFGNRHLKLPDLALKAEGHHQGSETFDMFANMLAYLRESGAEFAPGHTMQIGEDVYLRLREPAEAEWYLESDGQMLVAEKISSAEINREP